MTDIALVTAADGERFDMGPISIRVLENGANTDNRLGAVEITVAPHADQTPPLHSHKMHDETFLVLSGTVRFGTGTGHHDVTAGGYVVVPVGAVHTFANPFDEPAVFFNSFTPAFYVDYLRELSQLAAAGDLTPEANLRVMAEYATLPA